ncbi:MAG: C25 family cysteine peptidase, partial [bacterium]
MVFLFISFIPDNSYALKRWVPFFYSNDGSKRSEPGALPEIIVLQSNENHTLINILIPGMWVEDIVGPDGQVYQKLEIPEYGTTNDISYPELPSIRGLIGITYDLSNTINLLESDEISFDNYYVWPVQIPARLDGSPPPPFVKDEGFYNTDEFYPALNVKSDGNGFFKYLWVNETETNPIQFNPVQRKLNIKRSLIIDINYLNDVHKTFETIDMNYKFVKYFEDNLWNYEFLDINVNYDPSVCILIYNDDNVQDIVQSFANWIMEHYNYDAYVYKMQGQNTDELRDYIFTSWLIHQRKLDYVYLFGFTNKVPIKYLPSPTNEKYHEQGIPSDYFYGCCYGKDLLPEIAIGRIPYGGNDPREDLMRTIGKITGYYLNPPNPPPVDWRRNVLLVAHKQRNDTYNFSNQCDNIANFPAYFPRPTFEKVYGIDGKEEPNNKNIIDNINDGVSSVMYIGHGCIDYYYFPCNLWIQWCRYSDWYKPEFPLINSWYYEHIRTYLTNYNKYPVVFNMVCLNGDITKISLCDPWLRFTNNGMSVGTVTNMGFTDNSYGFERDHDYPSEQIYKYIYYHKPYWWDSPLYGFGWIVYYSMVDTLKRYGAITDCSDYDNVISYVPRDNFARQNAIGCINIGDPALRIKLITVTKSINKESEKIVKKENLPISVNFENPVLNILSIKINSINDMY